MRSIRWKASLSFSRLDRAQDAVDDLGIDAVAVEILDAQMRVGDAADRLGAVGIEAGLGT